MPVADKINKALASNDFSIACLQLCEVSYLPLDQIAYWVAQIPPLTPGGVWVTLWWAQDDIDANLAFVAGHYPQGETTPDWAVLTIRGTDIDEWDILGILWQLWEDLDFMYQTRLPWALPGPDPLIAQGTLDGINDILRLSFNGSTLEEYLSNRLATIPGLGFAVTGHSLGGCLATVMASRLRGLFSNAEMLPVTFAGPTAGDSGFVSYFQTQFPQSLIYGSKFDIAPKAWGKLADLDNIYDPTYRTPWGVQGSIAALDGLMQTFGINYTQPNPIPPPIPAQIDSTLFDWFAEAFYQHHPATYMKWFGGKNVGLAPPVMLRTGKPTPATPPAHVGPLPEVVRRLRAGVGPKPTT